MLAAFLRSPWKRWRWVRQLLEQGPDRWLLLSASRRQPIIACATRGRFHPRSSRDPLSGGLHAPVLRRRDRASSKSAAAASTAVTPYRPGRGPWCTCRRVFRCAEAEQIELRQPKRRVGRSSPHPRSPGRGRRASIRLARASQAHLTLDTTSSAMTRIVRTTSSRESVRPIHVHMISLAPKSSSSS